MSNNSIVFGILMVITGIVGVMVANMDGKSSVTALIPAAIGALLVVFGFVSRSKENLRKHLMHVAMLLVLIGAGGMIGRWISTGTFTNPNFALTNALIVQLSFAVLSVAYLASGIKSFIDARRNPKN